MFIRMFKQSHRVSQGFGQAICNAAAFLCINHISLFIFHQFHSKKDPFDLFDMKLRKTVFHQFSHNHLE